MFSNATQDVRQLAVFTPLESDELLLRRFDGHEGLSQLFEYELEMLSLNDAIDPGRLLGRNVTFRLSQSDSDVRHFNGYVSRFWYAGNVHFASIYRATVVPWLWFLTNTSDCRIFQDQTVPAIIERIFVERGFQDFDVSGLQETYRPREYCVQYRETDFDFVSRLMEEEGIFYFFRHHNGKHVLCLADQNAAFQELADAEVEFTDPDRTGDLTDQITAWTHQYEFRPGRWAQTDYNFRQPHLNLMSQSQTAVSLPRSRAFEIYEYPGRFDQPDAGRSLARIRMEEQDVAYDTVSATGTYRSFAPGGRFRIKSHRAAAEVGKSYVLTTVRQTASINGSYITGTQSGEIRYENRFTCIPADVAFRPQRLVKKPVIQGPQTAVVVGPPGEQIYPDEFGRVKVQFPWDREGRRDENSSCWIRVSQVHAGRGWGTIDLPRIGEEVIVSFLDGDPDRPIIKGRVYNGKNRPPFALPGGMTRSGLKSNTHKGSGYNEITMDDAAGQEQLRVNAQYDMDMVVANNETVTIAVDRITDVGNNDTLTIGVDATTDIGNNNVETSGNNTTVEIGNNLVIEAGTAITLQCGASTIHMNQAGVITISGAVVTSAASATNSIVAPMAEIVGSQMLASAGLVTLKLGGVNHVKGNSTSLSGASIEICGGETILKGAPLELGEVGAPAATLAGSGAGGSGGGPSGPNGPAGPGGGDGADGGAEASSQDGTSAETGSTEGELGGGEGSAGAGGDASDETDGSDTSTSQQENDVTAPSTGTTGLGEQENQTSDDETPFPPEVAARRTEISEELARPDLSDAERDQLLNELSEIDRQHNSGIPGDSGNWDEEQVPPGGPNATSSQEEPGDHQTPEVPMTDAERERAAGALERAANRQNIRADMMEFLDPEEAKKLREQSQQLDLEAARLREGTKGVRDKQRQHDAGDATRELIDVLDKYPLPKNVEVIKDLAKGPIKAGLPKVVEKVIEMEQDFHDKLREIFRGK